MIFLSTDKASQETKNHPLDTRARKNQPSLSAEKRVDRDKTAIRKQDVTLPDAQWHRSKTAKFSQY